MDPNFHLRNELVRDAEGRCRVLGVPAAVIVSGDIAFGGIREEYDFALTWLDRLCQRCGTSLSSVFLCPGNHDVVRPVPPRRLVESIHRDIKATADLATLDNKLRGILSDSEAASALYHSLAPYNLFAVQFFCDLYPPDRTIAKRELVLNDGSLLRLWGLNSVFVSSQVDRPGDLFVDPACLQITREPGIENLVMCHHPYTWLRQGGLLKDHLNDVSRLHLFGHEHTNRIEVGRDWIRVAASAAHPDRTDPGWEPGYNLIELEVTGNGAARYLSAKVHVRVWQTSPGMFHQKADRHSDVFEQRIHLDTWEGNAAPPPAVGRTEPLAGRLEDKMQALSVEVTTDPMSTLRDISLRFSKLTLSQKSAIAGKLGLLEEEDVDQPDFERFRRIMIRARERNLVQDLEREIIGVQGPS